MYLISSGTSNCDHRRQLSRATRRDIARNKDCQDGEKRREEIMPPIPGDEKIIRVEQAANSDGNMRHSPGHQGTKRATENGSCRRDQRALPQKDRADIDPAITHRSQNRDLLNLGQHRHREHIENSKSGEQDDERNGNRYGHSQSQKKLQGTLLAILPTRSTMLE